MMLSYNTANRTHFPVPISVSVPLIPHLYNGTHFKTILKIKQCVRKTRVRVPSGNSAYLNNSSKTLSCQKTAQKLSLNDPLCSYTGAASPSQQCFGNTEVYIAIFVVVDLQSDVLFKMFMYCAKCSGTLNVMLKQNYIMCSLPKAPHLHIPLIKLFLLLQLV